MLSIFFKLHSLRAIYFHNLDGQSSTIIKTKFLKHIVSLIFGKKAVTTERIPEDTKIKQPIKLY